MTSEEEVFDALKHRVVVDRYGTRRYYNGAGLLHRTDGPAVEHSDGSKEWYLNGELHRDVDPAIECANGTKEWYLNGELHREDGPAVEYANGTKEWWLNGIYYTKHGYLMAGGTP